jgi:NADH pyrophosphatase NudC (nudix superfamily)
MKDEALKLALEALELLTDTEQTFGALDYGDNAITALKEALAQPAQERNFCPRCGKRTADLTVIHTCTPPQEKNT